MTTFDSYTYEIQYQELDGNRRLRLYTLENMLLNVAGRAADKLGFGMHALFPRNLTWVITHLALEMDMLPTEGDTLRIETWVENYVHLLSIRDFRIWLTNAAHKEPICIGQARSQWTVISLIDRTVQNLADDPIFMDKEYGEALPMERSHRMRVLQEVDEEKLREIVYSDIDYNGHCNSCKYLEMMINAYPKSVEQFPMRLDLKYARELHQGEVAKVRYSLEQDDVLPNQMITHYEIRTESGEISCQAMIRKKTT